MNQPFQMVQCTPTIPHTPYISTKSATFADSDVRSLNTSNKCYGRLCATRVSDCWQILYVVRIERESVRLYYVYKQQLDPTLKPSNYK